MRKRHLPENPNVGEAPDPPTDPSDSATRRRSWERHSITARVWQVIGGLILIILVASFVLQNSMATVDQDVTQITEVEEAITAAAYEMEINVNGTGMGVLQYLNDPDPEFRARVAKDEADFERFQAEFDALASTSEERQLAAEIAVLYSEFKALGVDLMNLKDAQERLFSSVALSSAEIDHIVDEELQPIIDASTVVGITKTLHAVEMELNAAEVAAWLGNYLRVGSEEYRSRITDDPNDFWVALLAFRQEGATEAEESVLVELAHIFATANGEVGEVLEVHDKLASEVVLFTSIRVELDDLLDEEIQLLTSEALTASRVEAHASIDRMSWVIRLMIAATVVGGGMAALFLTRRIIVPVRRLSEGAERMGRGDMKHRIAEERDDELGEVARAFNLMAERRYRAQKESASATEQLAATNSDLTRSNEDLEHFSSVAAHDLQEPLRKIEAFSDRLATKLDGTLDDQGQMYIDRMLGATSRMRGLINDLLSYSRLSTEKKAFETVVLTAIVHDAVCDLSALLEETQGTVTIEPLPVVDGIPSQMRQLLQNLIGNALKYHRKGEAPVVTVSTTAGDTSSDTIQLIVEDNGIGFDPEYAERIFGVFERLHGRDAYPGTGIGLPTVRRIAERHGGTVTATSGPGRGSTFTVTLPLTRPKSGALQ